MRFFSFVMIQKQFLPPKPGLGSGEDSLASSTQSLITDLDTPIDNGGSNENVRYGWRWQDQRMRDIALAKLTYSLGNTNVCPWEGEKDLHGLWHVGSYGRLHKLRLYSAIHRIVIFSTVIKCLRWLPTVT